jgi:hypothetical protein
MRQGTTFALVPLCLMGIMLSPAHAGTWSLPDESRGSRVAPLFLLSRADVREDIQFPASQVSEVDKAIVDLFNKAADLKGMTGEAAIAQRKLVDQSQKAWLEAHLSLDQVDRLSQIDLRWEGPAAMTTRPSVADVLSLSDEQRAALHRAVLDRNAHRDKTKDVAAAEHQLNVRAMTILSDGQKKRWEQMLGRPIAVRTAAANAPRQPAR